MAIGLLTDTDGTFTGCNSFTTDLHAITGTSFSGVLSNDEPDPHDFFTFKTLTNPETGKDMMIAIPK